MGSRTNQLIDNLLGEIKRLQKEKTSAYDTQATVKRIEDGVAWVHIPGGVDETPTKLTINAQAGDTVQVRVSGGRAFLVGNATAPPTDDRIAKAAYRNTESLTAEVGVVDEIARTARKIAKAVQKIAETTNQYFWHLETIGDLDPDIGTGAHITEVPQEEFLADPENGGGNLLARSNGIAIRDGLTELATIGADASKFSGTDGSVLIKNNVTGIRTFTEVVSEPYNDDVTITLDYTPVDDSFVLFLGGGAAGAPTPRPNKYNTWDSSRITHNGNKSITVDTGSSSGLHPATTGKLYVMYDTEEFATTSVGIGAFEDDDFGSGKNSLALGDNTKSYGENSLAQGKETIARGVSQVVIGEYNEPDETSLFIIGNGSVAPLDPPEEQRSNALTVDTAGNMEISGDFVAESVNGYDLETHSNTTVNSIFQSINTSEVDITNAKICKWGEVKVLTFNWENKAAISVPANGNIYPNITIGTLNVGYVPAVETAGISHGDNAGAAWYRVMDTGEIRLAAMEGTGTARTIAADSTFTLHVTYI